MKRNFKIILVALILTLTTSIGFNVYLHKKSQNLPVNMGHYTMFETYHWYQFDVFIDNHVILTGSKNEIIFEGPMHYDEQLDQYIVQTDDELIHITSRKNNVYIPITQDGKTFVGVFTKGGDVPAIYRIEQ